MRVLAPSRWPWLRRWFGNRSERAAERFLRHCGCRILKRNYLCPGGELDLIALDGDCVVFVEVRSTADRSPLRPAQSVDAEKQRRMTHAALHFQQRYQLRQQQCRLQGYRRGVG